MIQNNDAFDTYATLLAYVDRVNLDKGCSAPENVEFVNAALRLARLHLPSPFEEDSRADDYYHDLLFFYNRTQPDKMNCPFKTQCAWSARSMIKNHGSENPFCMEGVEEISFEELQDVEFATTEAEDIMSGTYVPAQKVFGVVPEQQRTFIGKKRRKRR
jgi:hypothetical protein